MTPDQASSVHQASSDRQGSSPARASTHPETPPGPRASPRRAVFLDIDGTYADHGVVPEANARAVMAARAAGHLVFLCTGRPLSMIPPAIQAAGFDGLVASAGAYVRVGDAVLVDRTWPEPLATRARAVLDAHSTPYVLEAAAGNHVLPGVLEALQARWSRRLRAAGVDPETAVGLRDIAASITAHPRLDGIAFAKITCIGGSTPIASIAREIGPEVAAIPSSLPDMGEGAGEIFLADVHKAIGVEAVAARLGLERASIVAVGDGLNDLEMIEHAGLGVAIEDGHPRLLAIADRTAPPPAAGGIAVLFAELGLT